MPILGLRLHALVSTAEMCDRIRSAVDARTDREFVIMARTDALASEGLEAAVTSRSELFQAQGMVMIQLGVSLAAAMSRLRAHAFAHDRRLADVARDVVARRLKLEPDRTPDGPD